MLTDNCDGKILYKLVHVDVYIHVTPDIRVATGRYMYIGNGVWLQFNRSFKKTKQATTLVFAM